MEPLKSRQKLLSGLFQLLHKTVKSLRMYPSGHPTSDVFLAQTYAAFTDVLSWLSPLRITVDRETLLLDGNPVYAGEAGPESLSFVLYRDGIRDITFRSGLRKDEVFELASALSMDFTDESTEDDLATYLWGRDLDNLSVTVIDDYFEDYLPDSLKNARDLAAAVKKAVAPEEWSPEELKKLIRTPPSGEGESATLPLKRPFLGEESVRIRPHELSHLREIMAREGEGLFFSDMLEIVLDIMAGDEESADLEVFNALFRNLLRMLLSSGDLELVHVLISRLKGKTSPGEGATPALQAVGESFFNYLGSPEIVEVLGESLRLDRMSSLDSLPSLLALFPHEAIPSLVSLFETVPSLKARKTLCVGLAEIGRSNLEALAQEAGSGRWHVVRNVAFTLGIIGTPETIPYLGNLARHDHPRVRKEALRALGEIGGKASADWISQVLDHPDPETRLLAAKALPRSPNADLSERVLQIVRSDHFENRDLKERLEFFRLLGGVSSDGLLEELKDRLTPRRWLPSRRSREEQYLAVTALTALNTAAARGRLEKILPRADEKAGAQIRACLSRSPRETASGAGTGRPPSP